MMDLGDREIKEICGIDIFQRVGERGVEKIVVEREAGQMAEVPWLEVWKDNEVWRRYNAQALDYVGYKMD